MTNAKLEVRVRRLETRDDRSGFRSGNIDLDRFFQRYAGQNQFRYHIGTTYVAVQGDRIAGFATVSSGEMAAEKLKKNCAGVCLLIPSLSSALPVLLWTQDSRAMAPASSCYAPCCYLPWRCGSASVASE